MTDDFSPMYVGDTYIALAPSFGMDLTGAAIELKMVNEPGTTIKTGVGAWVIDDASNGLAHYNWSPSDVDTAGMWTLYIKVTFPSGKFVHADTLTLEILSAP